MVNKKIKNFILNLKHNIKKKKVFNNNSNIQYKIYIKNTINKIKKKKINSSQFEMSRNNIKKKINLNRWEMYKLFNLNMLPAFKKINK